MQDLIGQDWGVLPARKARASATIEVSFSRGIGGAATPKTADCRPRGWRRPIRRRNRTPQRADRHVLDTYTRRVCGALAPRHRYVPRRPDERGRPGVLRLSWLGVLGPLCRAGTDRPASHLAGCIDPRLDGVEGRETLAVKLIMSSGCSADPEVAMTALRREARTGR